jgi:hypothetical protein
MVCCQSVLEQVKFTRLISKISFHLTSSVAGLFFELQFLLIQQALTVGKFILGSAILVMQR